MEKTAIAGLSPVELAECKTGATLGPMRRPAGAGSRYRAKGEGGSGCFHVMSRTAGGAHLFDDVAKEAFRKMMWRMAAFAGVEILTYCVMENHFHILLSVPRREKWLRRFDGDAGSVGEEALLKHLSQVYSTAYMAKLVRELGELRASGRSEEAQDLMARYKARFCDVSTFVKELKERFSRWYNKVYERRGTLWMDRFKSVLVESKSRGSGRRQGIHDPLQNDSIVLTMANYIDLNPVRAGLCEDPKDYRFSGYGEAVAGSRRARRGLCRAMGAPLDDWEEEGIGGSASGDIYRMWIIGKAHERRDPEGGTLIRQGMTREGALEIIKNEGQLTREELLLCRIRYFSEGKAIGSRQFVLKCSPNSLKRLTPGQVVTGLSLSFCCLRPMMSDVVG